MLISIESLMLVVESQNLHHGMEVKPVDAAFRDVNLNYLLSTLPSYWLLANCVVLNENIICFIPPKHITDAGNALDLLHRSHQVLADWFCAKSKEWIQGRLCLANHELFITQVFTKSFINEVKDGCIWPSFLFPVCGWSPALRSMKRPCKNSVIYFNELLRSKCYS